jgi:hypothetical protein
LPICNCLSVALQVNISDGTEVELLDDPTLIEFQRLKGGILGTPADKSAAKKKLTFAPQSQAHAHAHSPLLETVAGQEGRGHDKDGDNDQDWDSATEEHTLGVDGLRALGYNVERVSPHSQGQASADELLQRLQEMGDKLSSARKVAGERKVEVEKLRDKLSAAESQVLITTWHTSYDYDSQYQSSSLIYMYTYPYPSIDSLSGGAVAAEAAGQSSLRHLIRLILILSAVYYAERGPRQAARGRQRHDRQSAVSIGGEEQGAGEVSRASGGAAAAAAEAFFFLFFLLVVNVSGGQIGCGQEGRGAAASTGYGG